MKNIIKNIKRTVAFMLAMAIMIAGSGFNNTTVSKAASKAADGVQEIERYGNVGDTVSFTLTSNDKTSYKLSCSQGASNFKCSSSKKWKDDKYVVTYSVKLLKAGSFVIQVRRNDEKNACGRVVIVCKENATQKSVVTTQKKTTTTEAPVTTESKRDKALRQEAAKVAKKVAGKSDKKKIKYIHDYICNNVKYDYDTYKDNSKASDDSYSAYGAIKNGKAVCIGYSEYTKLLMNAAGIKCVVVVSVNGEHAWNLVKYNGKWYNMDVTWDDQTTEKTHKIYYTWAMKSAADFSSDKKGWGSVGKDHTIGSDYNYKIATKSLDMSKW